MSVTTRAFDLPDHLAAKAAPELVARDEQHFDALATTLEQTVADLSERLAVARRAPAGRVSRRSTATSRCTG